MQLLLGLLLPLVLALDTRENSTSTISESSTSKPTTKATTHFDGTPDGPVLVGLVHLQRVKHDSPSIKMTEKSDKVNSGEYPQQQQETTEMPVFQRGLHHTDEEPSPVQISSVEDDQIHQVNQTSEEADRDQLLGHKAVETEETRSHRKLEHQEAPVIDLHQKAVEDVRRSSHVHQNMRHPFEVDDKGRAHHHPVQLPVGNEGSAHHPVQHVHLPAHLPIDDEGRAHLPVDPFSLHHPFLHTSVAEFEYSEWYLLLFSPSNASLVTPNTDSLPNQLTRSLAEKLEVSSSTFHISSIDSNRSGVISANISLARLTVPHLHRNLCHLPEDEPVFEFDGKNFTLLTVRHDKNQHLYIRTNPSTTTTGDELGLLLTVTLGGLGMFLLVMAFSFLAAQIVSKQDISGVSDLEDILVEHREGSIDSCDVMEKEIFIIDNSDESDETHERFCGEERHPGEASKEEMKRWKESRGEGEREVGGRQQLHFGRLGARLGRSWRELWDAPRLIDID